MGKSSSKERRDKTVKISPGSPKETESGKTPPKDTDYKGKTTRVPKDILQGSGDFPNTPITVHSNSFSSSKSTNGTLQTITRVTELSIIDNDTGGNDITDQLDSGPVSHNKSDTASYPNVQTAKSENDEQTIPMAKEDKKETKKKKKKKNIFNTSVKTEPFEPMKAGTTEQGDSGVKDKMRPEPSEPMKAECWLTQEENTNGKNKMRPKPSKSMKTETTQCRPLEGEDTGVKNKMRTGQFEPMKAGTTEQGDSGVKDKMRQEPSEPMKTGCWLPQEENTGVKNKMSVSEQQVKTMTMEAERLAEHCRFDIEMSKTDQEELILCPRAFIQSISSVEKHISNLTWENSKLVMEKHEYLNRLSSAAAAGLIDNNSNITNLGDPNRPTKLADKFNKIYENEWTDMIEKLEKKGPKTEGHKDKCVYHLYSVLIVIFYSLAKKAEVQLKGLAEHLFLLTKPSTEQIDATRYEYKEERVQLIASRKKTAETTIVMLHQTLQTDPIFAQELRECSPPLDDVMLSDILPSEYFKKCVEICWYFVIQDPPMYVETVSLKGRKIDKDTHKVYTKSGDIVNYHVWPALYLHHQDGTNSPLMGKGVVQPK